VTMRKTRIKNLSKAVEAAIVENAPEKAQSCLREAQKYIEKIGHKKGTLHRRTASRQISRLTKKVNALLKREIKQIQKSHQDGWEIFNQMGAFAPAFGMVGTLIGLIQMLADLSDVNSVGPKMAIALITTFYY